MSIYDNIRDGKYKNTKPYRPPEEYLEKADPENMTGKQLRELKERNEKRKKDYSDAYYAEESRLGKMFRDDIEEECGVKGHPKLSKLWEIAESHGHSGGYEEVANYFCELSELLT